MPYSVVDNDTSLQVRATIEYANVDDLRNLIATLQNRLDKMEKSSGPGTADPVQSLPAGDASHCDEPTDPDERTPEARTEEGDEASGEDRRDF